MLDFILWLYRDSTLSFMTLVQQNNDQAYNYLVVEVGNRAKFLWSSVTKMTGKTLHAPVVIHLTYIGNFP